MKGSSHITTILGNEIVVMGGVKGWYSVIQMRTGASVIFPATVKRTLCSPLFAFTL